MKHKEYTKQKKSFSLKKLTLIIFIAAIICTICTLSYRIYSKYLLYFPVSYTSDKYTQTTNKLDNPYCGFYRIYAYALSENKDTYNASSLAETIDNAPYRLALIEINLNQYRDTVLSDTALSQLDYLLSSWSHSGKQLILRFLYDWNGNAVLTEPTDIEIIIKHMEQTASIYNKYADNIFIIQGLYTGDYGEMHHSYHQSDEDIARLATKLYNISDKTIFLAVRTPKQLRTISKLTDGLTSDRLSLFNDGMLASANDAGTYEEDMRENELAFQNELCVNVPNGGEVIIDNPFNELDKAIDYMNTIHVSYLNSDYDTAVLDKWKQSVYHGDNIFDGLSGYDYIDAHLGYRYNFNKSSLSFNYNKDTMANITINIKNTGFSKNYYPFKYTLSIVNSADNNVILKYDISDKTSYNDKSNNLTNNTDSNVHNNANDDNNKKSLTFNIDIRSLTPDDYDIYLLTTDIRTGEIIKYATDTDVTENGCHIGSLKINAREFKSFIKEYLL